MNRLYKVAFVLALIAFSAASFAVPYASFIRTNRAVTGVGSGLDISYVLNDSADSVAIEVLDSGSSVVATFSGTTTQGDNSVSWNGTADNASGAAIPVGSDYTIKITVDKNIASWTQYLARQSGTAGEGQVFEGFSPNGVAVPSDTTSDVFGTVLVTNSWNTRNGVIQMRADLLTLDGDDGLTDFLDSGITANSNWCVWSADVMPNGRDCFITGQEGLNPGGMHWLLDGSSGSFTAMTDSDPNDDISTFSDGPWFRGMCVAEEGGKTYGYGAFGTSVAPGPSITKWEIVDGLAVAGSAVNILSVTSGSRMSDVETDAAGNLYFTVESSADGSLLFRLDASLVQPISAAAPAVVSAVTQASWVVSFPAPWDQLLGVDVAPDGTVYALNYDGDTDTAAIFVVGNSSEASVVKTLADPTDIVATDFSVDSVYARIHTDLFGNVYVYDRGTEWIWAWTPPGNFSSAVDAPTSQSFDIVTVTGVDNWDDFK